MKDEINVLGTTYKLLFKSEEEEPRLKENWGFTDFYTKEIIIRNDITKETEYS